MKQGRRWGVGRGALAPVEAAAVSAILGLLPVLLLVAAYERWQFHFGKRKPFFRIEQARIPLPMFDGSGSLRITTDATPGPAGARSR